MSNSVRPSRWQPTRLLCPWDSPGKNTGVGCHFLLQCMKVKSESEVAQSCPTLSDPMDCSLPGSSVHGIFQARVLEWNAIASSYSNHRLVQITKLFYHVSKSQGTLGCPLQVLMAHCNGNPLQYSCLENPMDRGAWWAMVHRVAKSQT